MPEPRSGIAGLKPYAPGLSIAQIQQQYGLSQVIKLASNENPLGASPLAQEAVRRHAASLFRYPQGGNPRLVSALAEHHKVAPQRVVVGNGSDELIDLLLRILAEPGRHSVVCFKPCFSIYPIQSRICGLEVRRQPLNADFSFDFEALLAQVDDTTRLVFITTPDNPSGYCPAREDVARLAEALARRAPQCLLVVDEAYADLADDETAVSLLAAGNLPENTAFLRTFSKSWGLAGMRLGYAVLPPEVADYCWRARLPFSVNILAEEAGLAALADTAFREATLRTVRQGRVCLSKGLQSLGCTVWPSAANFLLFSLPRQGQGSDAAHEANTRACFEFLLRRGIIIRPLTSYDLPGHLRVSVGDSSENAAFLAAMRDFLQELRA